MGKGGGWKDGCSRLLTAVVVVPGMEIGWLEGIEREGQGLDWIGLDWIAYWKNFRDTPTTTNHDTYLPFFQTQKYNVTFVKL